MIFVIVAAILAYRRANENGKNGILWAVIAVVQFIAVQLIASVVVGAILGLIGGVGMVDAYVWIATIVAIGASVVSTYLLLKFIERPADDGAVGSEPPPPPTFTGS